VLRFGIFIMFDSRQDASRGSNTEYDSLGEGMVALLRSASGAVAERAQAPVSLAGSAALKEVGTLWPPRRMVSRIVPGTACPHNPPQNTSRLSTGLHLLSGRALPLPLAQLALPRTAAGAARHGSL